MSHDNHMTLGELELNIVTEEEIVKEEIKEEVTVEDEELVYPESTSGRDSIDPRYMKPHPF